MRARLAVLASVVSVLVLLLIWRFYFANRPRELSTSSLESATAVSANPATSKASDSAPTVVSAHNLLLHKGADFRVYIPWLRGRMVRTHRDRNPDFDESDSFFL